MAINGDYGIIGINVFGMIQGIMTIGKINQKVICIILKENKNIFGICLIQGIMAIGKINKKLSTFFFFSSHFWPQAGTATKLFEYLQGMVPKTHTKLHNNMPMHS